MEAEVEAHKLTMGTRDISSSNISHLSSSIITRHTTGNKIKTLRTKALAMTLINIIITRINTPINIPGSRILHNSTTITAAVALLNLRQTKVITD